MKNFNNNCGGDQENLTNFLSTNTQKCTSKIVISSATLIHLHEPISTLLHGVFKFELGGSFFVLPDSTNRQLGLSLCRILYLSC